MATETTQVAEPFLNPWYPNAIPPIDPGDPRIVHATGEFGPECYIGLRCYSPAKYPRLKRYDKRTTKMQCENCIKSSKGNKKKQGKNDKNKNTRYIDMGANSSAKNPTFEKSSKGNKKKQGENGKREKPRLELDFVKVKKGMAQVTLGQGLFKPQDTHTGLIQRTGDLERNHHS